MAEGGAPISAPGDRRLSVLPFAHVGAMTRMWDELVNRITTVIVPSPWRAETAIALIGDEAVTVCQGVPTQYRMMFDHPSFDEVDTASLRVAGIGAARIPPELVLEMREKLGCPVVVRYASTESCLATGTRLDDDLATITTTVGRPNGGVELTIVDDEGSTCPAGEVGTVCLRSRAQMRGYWHDPERTAEAIDDDGWLHTGDLGWVGNDGNLRLAGRQHRDVHPRWLQRVPDRGRELPRRAPRRAQQRRAGAARRTPARRDRGAVRRAHSPDARSSWSRSARSSRSGLPTTRHPIGSSSSTSCR